MRYTKYLFYLFFLIFLFQGTLYAQNRNMVIVIDPGHGGKDFGASSGSIKEKDIVLNIGLKLGKYISENFQDVDILYTRKTDTFIPLYKRAILANKNKADLFISLHANFCAYPSITGTETYILGLHRSEENLKVAKKENSVILFEEDHSEHYEGFDPNSSESYIMFELIQDEFLEQSLSFANMVENQFKTATQRKSRGVKQAGFLVLRKTGMPSVLVESGFISNKIEANFLNSQKGQDYIAYAIFKAFSNYKKAFDAKNDYKLASKKQATNDNAEKKPQSVISEKKDSIYFSLQIAATQKNIKSTHRKFKNIDIWQIKGNNIYKYYCGKSSDPDSIKKLQKQLKKRFPDSFIVAFKNGQIIQLQEALELIK